MACWPIIKIYSCFKYKPKMCLKCTSVTISTFKKYILVHLHFKLYEGAIIHVVEKSLKLWLSQCWCVMCELGNFDDLELICLVSHSKESLEYIMLWAINFTTVTKALFLFCAIEVCQLNVSKIDYRIYQCLLTHICEYTLRLC